MAPANTPGRKKRDNQANYFKVGVQGRKTGVTLKDTGVRDEYGLEPVEGIFSSPMRSPARQSQRKTDSTVVTSESMDVVQSSAVGPTEILTDRRRTQQAKSVTLPPKGRSPIKTTLGSSPRRQSAIASASILRHTSRTPDRPSSQPTVYRKLDFRSPEPRRTIEGIEDELEAELPISSPAQRTIKIPRPERPDVFDLRPSPVQNVEDHSPLQQMDEAAESQLVGEQDSYLVNGVSDNSIGTGDADDTLQSHDDQQNVVRKSASSRKDQLQAAHQETTRNSGKRRGRPRKSDLDSSILQPSSASGSANVRTAKVKVNGNVASTRKRGMLEASETENASPNLNNTARKPKNSMDNPRLPDSSEIVENIDENEDLDASPTRISESGAMNLNDSVTKDTNDSKSKKRLHRDGDDGTLPKTKKKRQSLPPPSQRSPNAKISGIKSKKLANARLPETGKYRADEIAPRPKSSHIIRQGTPMDEPGAHVTRYGRASFKPLAWYRGEGVRWSQRSSRDELPGVQEIVRVEDNLQLPFKRPKKPGRKRKGSAMSTVDEVEEELEGWEEGDGFLMGTALGWDSIEDDVTNEDEDLYVAFAEKALRPREVPGANFRLAKCLTLDFFGAGIVELPPMGIKKSKNARRMQMVFFVHTGKVHVEVANREFSISKGGIWQVPRGNWYSIANNGDRVAKVFFAQGNEIFAGEMDGAVKKS